MTTTAAFQFRQLMDDDKILIGDFLSKDEGKNLVPISNYEWISLYAGNIKHMQLTVWRVTEQVS